MNSFRRTTLRIPTNTSRMSCFFCGNKNYYIWECKFLKNKNDEDGNANKAIVIKDIIAMVSNECKKINLFHMTVITNPSDCCFDSGATTRHNSRLMRSFS